MPRSDVITVAELLGRVPGATSHVRLESAEAARRSRRGPWLSRTNKTSAAITFGSVLAVGTTLAVGSTLLPARQSNGPVDPATPGPATDSTSVTPHEAIQEPTGRAPSGPTMPAPHAQQPAVPAPRRPSQSHPTQNRSALGNPGELSAYPSGQGRHAASTPRGPHLDSHDDPVPTTGPDRSGKHRDADRRPSAPRRDSSGSDRSGGGLDLGGTLGHTLDGLSIGLL